MIQLNESIFEDAALSWFAELGYACTNGLLIAPGEPWGGRGRFFPVVDVFNNLTGQARISCDMPFAPRKLDE